MIRSESNSVNLLKELSELSKLFAGNWVTSCLAFNERLVNSALENFETRSLRLEDSHSTRNSAPWFEMLQDDSSFEVTQDDSSAVARFRSSESELQRVSFEI